MSTRTEFLAERKTGIGGSDIASVFNIGYGCRRRLWFDKRDVPPDYPFEETKAMRLGQVLEPFFADEYGVATNRFMSHPGMRKHPRMPELLVHADRLVWNNPTTPRENGVLEIKSVGRAMFYKIKREGLPFDYGLQLQHAMLVTGTTWGSFAIGSRDSGELMWWDVEAEPEIHARILEEGPKFWALVQNGPMPEALEPDDRRCQNCGYRLTCHGNAFIPTGEPSEYEQDESLAPLVREYVERRALVKEADELLDETKAEIQCKLGDRKMVTAGGAKIQYYGYTKKAYTVKEHVERPLRIYEAKR